MKNEKENTILIIWCSCLLVIFIVSYFSFNISVEDFSVYMGGGMSGNIVMPKNITYYSNYPNGIENMDPVVKNDKKQHTVVNNFFEIPSGYVFVGWTYDSSNTSEVLSSGDIIDLEDLEEDISLYAKWEVAPEPELVPSYGDVDKNSLINNQDYLLIENYLSGTNTLDEQAMLNADVNVDGKIDHIDADIVKQATLGTAGYTGLLPSKPILIYSLYEGNTEIDGEDNEQDSENKDDNGDESTDEDLNKDESNDDTSTEEDLNKDDDTDKEVINGNGSGTGSGTTGSGSNSSGNGENNNTSDNQPGSVGQGSASSSSGTPGTDSSNKDNKEDENDQQENTNENEIIEPEKIIYQFIFMNGKKEYKTTSCEALEDETCILILPSENPTKKNHTFTGWSKTKNCPEGNGIKKPEVVNESKTYYACYIKNDEDNKNKDLYAVIVVLGLSLISGRIIWHMISRFRKEQVEIDNDKKEDLSDK